MPPNAATPGSRNLHINQVSNSGAAYTQGTLNPPQSNPQAYARPLPCCSSTKLLAPFDGTDDWKAFFMPFERMAQRLGCNHTDRLDKLHERLRGSAMCFICSLPEYQREDHILLTEQLKQRYGRADPPSTVRRCLSELKDRRNLQLNLQKRSANLLLWPTSGLPMK